MRKVDGPQLNLIVVRLLLRWNDKKGGTGERREIHIFNEKIREKCASLDIVLDFNEI